jgi:putative transcriptional regulator
MPDGSESPVEDKTDWERLRAMTDDEVMAAALADPDELPATAEQLRQAKRVPRTKALRRATPFDSGRLDDAETADAADQLMAALDADENDPRSR